MSLPGIVTLTGGPEGIRSIAANGPRQAGADAPIAEDAIFQIASMTKAITSLAALMLVEQGKLALDTPLGDLLPELAAPRVFAGLDSEGKPGFRPAGRPITLRHLLTHTAGFGYEFMSAALNEALGSERAAPATLASLNLPLLFEPGERWEYGVNTDWAGRAIEAATGQTLGTVIAELIAGPLGMADTSFRLNDAQSERLAPLHLRGEDGALSPFPIAFGGGAAAEFEAGGAGLYSTASDYFRFLQLILNEGQHEGRVLYGPETQALLTSNLIGDLRAGGMDSVMPMMAHPYDPFPGMDCGWSGAFLINKEDGPNGRPAGSLAWAGIANCHYWIDLANRQAGIFMTQIMPFGDPEALAAFHAFERSVYGR